MLSIIIVNYKNESKTIFFVKEELLKVSTPHITVIINNSATDESNKTFLESLNAELITDINNLPNLNNHCYLIPSSDNLGFAKGNNIGADFSLKHFDIDYFLFSNNDIRITNSGVVEKLIKKIDSLPGIALIGPRIIGPDGNNQSPEPYIPFWNRYVWMYWMTPLLSAYKKMKLFKLDYSTNAKEGMHYKVMGSFFLVKAADYVKCGMMDPNTFLFAEEVILSERLSAIGKHVYYYPEVAVIHEHSQTVSQHLSDKNKLLTQFSSESYYYSTYRKVSSLSILIGKFSLKCYLILKRRLK